MISSCYCFYIDVSCFFLPEEPEKFGIESCILVFREMTGKLAGTHIKDICFKTDGCLVGALEPWNFMTFHSVGIFIIPTDLKSIIFQRGWVETSNKMCKPEKVPHLRNSSGGSFWIIPFLGGFCHCHKPNWGMVVMA